MSHVRGFGPCLMALLAWGVLSFGAVYAWAYWPLFAGAAALGIWGIVATRGWRDPRVRSFTYALGVLASAIAAAASQRRQHDPLDQESAFAEFRLSFTQGVAAIHFE